jgi:glucose/arabinose dehydrogenase
MKVLLQLVFFVFSFQLFAQPSYDFNEIAIGFSRPIDIANAGDGTNRLFVAEKQGIIRIIELDNSNNVLTEPFLDISGIIDNSQNEQGLLGLAFHPEYPDSGYIYVNYTRDPGPGLDRTVVERYNVSSTNPDSIDENTGLTIIEVEQDFTNHNGGDLNFGPDGYLYIGMGDGGSGGDPNCRAQDTLFLLGKMLRLMIILIKGILVLVPRFGLWDLEIPGDLVLILSTWNYI